MSSWSDRWVNWKDTTMHAEYKGKHYLSFRFDTDVEANLAFMQKTWQDRPLVSFLVPQFKLQEDNVYLFDNAQPIDMKERKLGTKFEILDLLDAVLHTLADFHDESLVNIIFAESGSLFQSSSTQPKKRVKLLLDYCALHPTSLDEKEAKCQRRNDLKRAGDIVSKWMMGIESTTEMGDIVETLRKGETEAVTLIRKSYDLRTEWLRQQHREERKNGTKRPERKFSEDELKTTVNVSNGNVISVFDDQMRLIWGKYCKDARDVARFKKGDERVFLVTDDWLTHGVATKMHSRMFIFNFGQGRFAVDPHDFSWVIGRPHSTLKHLVEHFNSLVPAGVKIFTFTYSGLLQDQPLLFDRDVFAILKALDDQEELLRQPELADRMRFVFAICDRVLKSSESYESFIESLDCNSRLCQIA